MNTINVYLLSGVTTYSNCELHIMYVHALKLYHALSDYCSEHFGAMFSFYKKKYLNINYLLKSETTRLKTIHELVKPF